MAKRGTKGELIVLPGSAWVLKARWALKYHDISYKTIPYTPVVGALWLRWRTGKWNGRVTTPVLITRSDGVLLESFDIALWADDHSNAPSAPPLFPADKLEEIRKWNAASDTALNFARSRVFNALRQDKAMLLSMLPPFLIHLGPLTDLFAAWYLGQFMSKYQDVTSSTNLEKTKAVLQELQEAIKANNGYVLGTFTYADVVMAVAVQVIEPVGPPYTKLSESRRAALTNAELKAEFGELLTWRNHIFTKHFPS